MHISDNRSLYLKLRNQYPEFIYESSNIHINGDELILSWEFRCNEILFCPETKIPLKKYSVSLQESDLLNYAFQIGMIELISYWKACCSPSIVIKVANLDTEAVDFWKKIYFNGLGEFFYLNNIDPDFDSFVNIHCNGNTELSVDKSSISDKILIPIGGGKDSVVTLEIIKQNTSENAFMPVIMNPRGATLNTLKASGLNDFIEIKRKIDPTLIELNSKGYLNGHTPFSAMLAFYTALLAKLFDYKHIALSNESSANEPTVSGTDINHQYSKSIEFEKDFRHYLNKYVHTEINYFSFLRPLSEIQIACLFSKYRNYHDVFRSCNAGSKTDVWCGKCPKCLFTFILLSAFLTNEELVKIFGYNLFTNRELIPVLDQLTGITPVKPFECVGTTDEVQLALNRHLSNNNYEQLPKLLKHYSLSNTNFEGDEFESHLKHIDLNHFLRPEFYKLLTDTLHESIHKTSY